MKTVNVYYKEFIENENLMKNIATYGNVVNGWGYEGFMRMNKYMEFRNMMTTTTSGKEEAILNLGSWHDSCTLRRSILIHHNHSKLLLI